MHAKVSNVSLDVTYYMIDMWKLKESVNSYSRNTIYANKHSNVQLYIYAFFLKRNDKMRVNMDSNTHRNTPNCVKILDSNHIPCLDILKSLRIEPNIS